MVSGSPPPPGLGIDIDRAVRLTDEGHVLVGGCPPQAVRLTPSQVSVLIRWLGGAAPRGMEEGLLARELLRAGLAHPRPLPMSPGDTVEVAVIGTAPGLDTTLDRIADLHPGLRPVVVGATGQEAWTARSRGARVVPGPVEGTAARAMALRVCSAEFVALVEAGAYPDTGWLDAALGHFADPGVAAVVPRVLTDRSRPLGHMRLAVAAAAASRVDRGADPAPVLPWGHALPGQGRPLPSHGRALVDPLRPFPALLLRRTAVNPGLALGDAADPDLLWCLVEDGWSVRYEPRSRVRMPPTTELGGYLYACYASGATAGPLARRRGRRAAGPELSWAGAVALALAATGSPGTALLAGALGGAAVVGTLVGKAGVPLPEAARVAGLDLAHTVRTGAHAVRTVWWPLAATAVVGGAVAWGRGARGGGKGVPGGALTAGRKGVGRRPSGSGRAGRIAMAAGAALVLPHVAAWRRDRGAAPVGPLAWTVLGMAGDAAHSLGAWWGMARADSLAPLVPRLRLAVDGTALRGRSGRGRSSPGSVRGDRRP